jgi:hypothetical protein
MYAGSQRHACAYNGVSQAQKAFFLYLVVAALNLTTSSAGTLPRSFTSMPCALAHSRTSVGLSPFAAPRRPARTGRRELPLTRRAAPT